MTKNGLIISFLLLFSLCSFSVEKKVLHPFHTSVSECVYNEKEKIWELSIRLFQDDLEQALTEFQGKKFQFQFASNPDVLLESYIRKHVGFVVNQKLQTPYRWIGWEAQSDAIWIYIEIPTANDLSGVYFQQSALTEVFSDQTNLLHVARKELKKSYLFQKNQPVQQISW
ncbi:MAG: DUF6702 family protein [Aquirufa sp.]